MVLVSNLGGDQGLLNSFFSMWSTGSNKTRRLPFTFNVTPSSLYSYLPAFKKYAKDIRVVHFIGQAKPWIWNRSSNGSIVGK
jgi:glycogenin